MILHDAVFKPCADVRFRIVADEAVVVRQEDAEVLAVNEVGASILELLDSRRSVRAVMDVLLEQYDVDPGQLETDVERFLRELRDAGVIQET
jgi:hypothetical protein